MYHQKNTHHHKYTWEFHADMFAQKRHKKARCLPELTAVMISMTSAARYKTQWTSAALHKITRILLWNKKMFYQFLRIWPERFYVMSPSAVTSTRHSTLHSTYMFQPQHLHALCSHIPYLRPHDRNCPTFIKVSKVGKILSSFNRRNS